jgi:hypothetical protein
MYWHEGRLLYAVTHFSVSELIIGHFNPNQLGGAIDTLVSSGYHLTKILHLQLLELLTSIPSTAETQLIIGSIASFLAIAACGLCVRGTLKEIGFARETANWSVVAFFLMPCIPYLAGKLLAEVSALLPAFAALWLWSHCLKTGLRASFVKALIVSVLVTITALARLDIVIAHIGFVAATVYATRAGTRAQLLRLHGFVCGAAGLLYIVVIAGSDGSFSSITAYFSNYLSLHPKSLPMSVFGLASFGGLMWVFAIAGSFMRAELKFPILIWLLICLVPIAGIVSNYMIEPRYLIASAMPFAALAGISLQRFFRALQSDLTRNSAIVLIALIAPANALPVALMPYEIDRKSILEVADTYARADADSALLVSWSYTDFHFLRYARPDANIFNVHSPRGDPGSLSREWDNRLRSWYGDRYITSNEALAEIEGRGSIFYLGWGVYPPVETLQLWARYLGLDSLSNRIARLPFLVHEEQSWLWADNRHELKPIASHGRYNVYEVHTTDP